jgi:hypothetical protein
MCVKEDRCHPEFWPTRVLCVSQTSSLPQPSDSATKPRLEHLREVASGWQTQRLENHGVRAKQAGCAAQE